MSEVEANFFTVREGAAFLGVSQITLRDAIRDKRVKAELRYGKIVLGREELEEYRARTQPNGVPQVGRPSNLTQKSIEQLLAERGSSSLVESGVPFSPQQLVEERNAVSRFLGERIRLRRMELGWNQTQLGKMLGFSREMIAHYEMGKALVHAADIPLFAKVLEVHLLWFYHNEPSVSTINPLWARTNAISDEDREEMDEIVTILARRRGKYSQETINFGPGVETRHVDESENTNQ